MSRLTTDKIVSEMSMVELAHNCCYADDERRARYRDYELDIDARDLAKMLIKDMCDEDLTSMTDEEFDDYIGEMLSAEMNSQIGLIALFYRNLWAMADLRERLKAYEDVGTLKEIKTALEKQKENQTSKDICHETDKALRFYRGFMGMIRHETAEYYEKNPEERDALMLNGYTVKFDLHVPRMTSLETGMEQLIMRLENIDPEKSDYEKQESI